MSEMLSGMGDGASQGAPSGAPSQVAPSGSPASQPMPASGQAAQAMAQVGQAIKILEQSLAKAGSSSELGGAILKALSALNKAAPGQDQAQLAPAQLIKLLSEKGQGAPAAPGGGGVPGGMGG